MLTSYEKAVLTLFKAVPACDEISGQRISNIDATVRHGFYITGQARKMCRNIADQAVLAYIEKQYGYDVASMNNGFYKNFHDVRDMSAEDFFVRQTLHYMSVFLQNGDMTDSTAINDAVVYIPGSCFDAPDTEPVKMTIIDYMADSDIAERTKKLAFSGVALSEQTLDCMIVIIKQLDLQLDVKHVPNKELRVRLYGLYQTVPDNAAELLRYIIYLKCGISLLVKDTRTIRALQYCGASDEVRQIICTFADTWGIPRLAEEFFHYKPLWLALKKKSSPQVKHIINRARKLADKYHKNYSPQLLERITSEPDIDLQAVRNELAEVTIFKKIAILTGIQAKLDGYDTGLYLIRNGKAFAREDAPVRALSPRQLEAAALVRRDIADTLRQHVDGKTVYIPDYIDYVLPTSEKQFMGGIPFYTSIHLGKRIVFGVHWENLPDERVDLDLHLNSDYYELGWDTQFDYNRADQTILFSGDMTDAPADKGGATEAFYMSDRVCDDFASIDLDDYTENYKDVPFSFVAGNAGPSQVDQDYLLDCHKLLVNIPISIDQEENVLGFVESDGEGNKTIYLAKAQFGYNIVSEYNEHKALLIKAFRNKLTSLIHLRPLLEDAGAVFVKADDQPWDIDLSPETLAADTILSLLQ